MKKDAWYAALAAIGLCALTAGYGLVSATAIADPNQNTRRAPLKASLPLPPVADPQRATETAALTILEERNPFLPGRSDEELAGRGLNLPKLAPPVRFSDPGERATVTAVPSPPRASAPQQPARAAVSEAPVSPSPAPQRQGSLTLRGVFPSPNGGQALVALPDGRVVSVGVGGVVGGWRVLGIEQGAIRIGRGQRKILLSMPR
jgi:hypothetical protein